MFTKRLKLFLGLAIALLLIPLLGMQFTEAIQWSLSDFVIAGILLLWLAILVEFILINRSFKRYKTVLVVLTLLVFILLWMEMAVGIFGSPLAGN